MASAENPIQKISRELSKDKKNSGNQVVLD
jgi:hypothetical protein